MRIIKAGLLWLPCAVQRKSKVRLTSRRTMQVDLRVPWTPGKRAKIMHKNRGKHLQSCLRVRHSSINTFRTLLPKWGEVVTIPGLERYAQLSFPSIDASAAAVTRAAVALADVTRSCVVCRGDGVRSFEIPNLSILP